MKNLCIIVIYQYLGSPNVWSIAFDSKYMFSGSVLKAVDQYLAWKEIFQPFVDILDESEFIY